MTRLKLFQPGTKTKREKTRYGEIDLMVFIEKENF